MTMLTINDVEIDVISPAEQSIYYDAANQYLIRVSIFGESRDETIGKLNWVNANDHYFRHLTAYADIPGFHELDKTRDLQNLIMEKINERQNIMSDLR